MNCAVILLFFLLARQSPACAHANTEDELLQHLRTFLAASPPKTTSTRRYGRLSEADQDTWPSGLLIGAGVSACQAEGAYNLYGKAESILDHPQHMPGFVSPFSTDVAADHYHRFREDLAFAKQMKFTSHRFSISWSRVLPTGGVDNVNQEGVEFYTDYINEIINNGMEPMVTMLHFDQPYTLEKATGGWDSPAMIDKYVDYADFLFKTFGDKVKYWTTLNEPNMYCSYFRIITAENGQVDYSKFYQCIHNIILAHMKSYKLYEKKYRPTQNGMVGISTLMLPPTPETKTQEDQVAAEVFNQVYVGTLIHPIVFGDYPPVVRYLIDKRDADDGLGRQRLPAFTPEEKLILAEGVTDFIALNVYGGCTASYNRNKTAVSAAGILPGPSVEDIPFANINCSADFSKIDSSVMHNALIWMWNEYHVPIIISENGYGDSKHAGVNDAARAAYHSANLLSLVRTMKVYDVKVLAYYAWSLIDLFEFSSGYEGRPFGLVHVDYHNGSLNRTLKDSSKFFIRLHETGRVPFIPEPEPDNVSAGNALFASHEVLALVCGQLLVCGSWFQKHL
ncbi:myrosinase 1-like [Frankliniella occidentalis]|uniref:Myrosinase 1-like n=1 Tax=Frankliniella occidentalis TaxID=133901 RepID=A0A9C6XRP8_FRAOC|nr:myrosinase 1-like [Frankliniella occidentalis]